MRLKIVLSMVMLLVAVQSKAQSSKDLFLSVWNDPSLADTTRVNALGNLASEWQKLNPDSAIHFAKMQLDFANTRGLTKYAANALEILGEASKSNGELAEAILYFQQSHDLYEGLDDKSQMATSLYDIGHIHWTTGDYTLAMEYYQQSIQIAEEIGDRKMEARCLTAISYCYWSRGLLSQANQLVQRSLKIYEEIGDDYGIAWCTNALGVAFLREENHEKALEYLTRGMRMNEKRNDKVSMSFSFRYVGDTYADMGNYNLALEYYEKSLAIDKELNTKRSLIFSYASIGILKNKVGQLEVALDYFQKGLDLAREIGNKDLECEQLELIGSIHIEMGNYNLGISECQKSYDISLAVGAIDDQLKACKCLYKANKEMGNLATALNLYETITILDDSMDVRALAQDLSQMEFQKQMLADSLKTEEEKLKSELKHQQEVAEKVKIRNISLGIGAFFILLAGGFYSRWRYVNKSKAIIESERDRSDNLLLNILPAEIAQELKEKGRATARDFERVSVLFTDFKGFTEQSALLSAAELVNEINHCFEAFDHITEKYGIEKIKTIGDSYMAAGGLPIPTEDSSKNTVLAALAMQDFILKRKAESLQDGTPAFAMRAGIHTGGVVAGIVGVKKFQYDIWGDTVNTASRMESSGEVGKVNISQATYELLKNDSDFQFESRGKIEAKGKGEIEMWFVDSAG